MSRDFEFGIQKSRKGNLRNSWLPGFKINSFLLLIVAFITSVALLTATQTRLAAQRYTQTPGTEAQLSTDPAAPKSFELVKFYSSQNVKNALGDLRVTANRACLIVPLGDDYANKREGNLHTSKRSSQFMLMIADKDFSKDASQMTGTKASPGILALKDLAVADFTSKPFVIGSRVVMIAPGAGALVQLEWQERDAIVQGRECWHQIFHAAAGEVVTQIGRRA